MTRETAKQNLIGFGIENPTDEQVTNYLNQVNGESQKEKARAEQYKEDAKKVSELQKKLTEMENANLSDIEKANKSVEEANTKIAELEKQIKRTETLKALADKGITGDDATNLIHEDGTIDFDTLGKILTDRETEAAKKKEQEIASSSTNPNGGKGEEGKDEKPVDVSFAETISFGNSASQDDRDAYKL